MVPCRHRRPRRRQHPAPSFGLTILLLLVDVPSFAPIVRVDAATKWVRETTGSGGPGRRSGAAGVIINRDLFVVGGESGDGRLLHNDAWSFSYQQERWIQHSNLPGAGSTGRAYAAVAAVSQNVIVYGGQCTSHEEEARGTPCVDHLWQFDYLSGTWSRLDTTTTGDDPGPRMGATLVKGMGATLYAFGGTKGGDRSGDWADDVAKHVYSFDVNGKIWTKLVASTASSWPSDLPFVPRYGHAAVYDTVMKEMVVYGGEMGVNPQFNTWGLRADVIIFDTDTNTWTRRYKSDFSPRKWAVAALHRPVSNQATPRSLLIVAGYGRDSIPIGDVYNTDRTGIMSYDFRNEDCCWSDIRPDVAIPAPEARHGMVGGLLDGSSLTMYGGATCVATNGGATLQCRAEYDEVWTYDMSGQRVEQGTVSVSLSAAAAAAPLGGGGVDHVMLLVAGATHVVEALDSATANAATANKVFAGVPAQEVIALALKSGIIVAAGRGNVLSQQTIAMSTSLVNASTLHLSLLREDGHSPYHGASATVKLYSKNERRNVSQPTAGCATDVDGKCQLFTLPTEPPMDYLQGLNAVADFTGSDATIVFTESGATSSGSSPRVLCEKSASIGRAPCCGQVFTCVIPAAAATVAVKELPLTALSSPTPGALGASSNHSGVTSETQMAYLRVSYSATSARESHRVQLLVSAPAVDGSLTVYASQTERFPNPTTAAVASNGVTSASGAATATTRADGSGRPGMEAELLVDIGAALSAAGAGAGAAGAAGAGAGAAGVGAGSGFVYVGVSVGPPTGSAATSSSTSAFYVRARMESKLAVVVNPPTPAPPPPQSPPRDISTIPGTNIAVPGGPGAVAGVLAAGGIVIGVILTVLFRRFLKHRERKRLEAKLRAEGRLPGGGGAKGGAPWRPPMEDIEEALGEKFNDSWSPGDGRKGGGGGTGDIYDELEEAHRSARPVSSQGIHIESGRAGSGAPLSPEMMAARGGGGGGGAGGGGAKIPGTPSSPIGNKGGGGGPWHGAYEGGGDGGGGGGGGGGLHPDVVGAYFAARNGGGGAGGMPGMPGMYEEPPPPSRGAYADDEPRPFDSPHTQAHKAEQGDVVGYMENVDAMADEYFRSLMGGVNGGGGGVGAEAGGGGPGPPGAVGGGGKPTTSGWRPMSANTVGRSTEALREKYKKLAGEGGFDDGGGGGSGSPGGGGGGSGGAAGGAPPPPPGVAPPPGAPGAPVTSPAAAAAAAAAAPRAPPGIEPPSMVGGGGGGGFNDDESSDALGGDVDILRMRKHLAVQGLRPTTPASAGVDLVGGAASGSAFSSGPSSPLPPPPLPPPPPSQSKPKPPPPMEEHPDDIARREAAQRRQEAAAKKARTAREALRAKIEQGGGGGGSPGEGQDELPPVTGSGRPAKSILKKTFSKG